MAYYTLREIADETGLTYENLLMKIRKKIIRSKKVGSHHFVDAEEKERIVKKYKKKLEIKGE